MISVRYHIVTIAAVFLALAVGVVLGSSSLSGRLLEGVGQQKQRLQQQVDALGTERDQLRAQVATGDRFDSSIAPLAVRGQLAGRSVVLISSSDARDADRDALTRLLRDSGADLTGEVKLGQALTDPDRSAAFEGVVTQLLPAGVQLPTAADPGTQAGGLLGPLTLLRPDGQPQVSNDARAAAFAGLADGGFAAASPGLRPAQLAVVLTGGKQSGDHAGDKAATVARFAAQIDAAGQGAVLAGASGSAEGSGAVGVARADPSITSSLSTVDNADAGSGRVAAVLAAREQANHQVGHYGVAASAQGPAPATRG